MEDFQPTMPVDGAKVGNGRKRQLSNEIVAKTTSPALKNSSVVDLTGSSPGTSTSNNLVAKKLSFSDEDMFTSDDDMGGESGEPSAKKIKKESKTPEEIPAVAVPTIKSKRVKSKTAAR